MVEETGAEGTWLYAGAVRQGAQYLIMLQSYEARLTTSTSNSTAAPLESAPAQTCSSLVQRHLHFCACHPVRACLSIHARAERIDAKCGFRAVAIADGYIEL